MGTRKNRLNEAVLTCTHNICFEQKYENSEKNQLKIVIFSAVKNRCILHGHVFVMTTTEDFSKIYPFVVLVTNQIQRLGKKPFET